MNNTKYSEYLNLVIVILPLKFFPLPRKLNDNRNNRSPRDKSQLSAAVFFQIKIFLHLMMFYPIAILKKAFMDSNHWSNISWPYKFRLFFRPLHVQC